MRAFRGPIEGFPEDDDGDVSGDDDEIVPVIGPQLFEFDSDEDDEIPIPPVFDGSPIELNFEDDDDSLDEFIVNDDNEDPEFNLQEEESEDDEDEEGVDLNQGFFNLGSSSSSDDSHSVPGIDNEESLPEAEQEHVHGINYSPTSAHLAPSPGPEVVPPSPEPELRLHRVYGEIDIHSRRRNEANISPAESDNVSTENAALENGVSPRSSIDDDELSDLSGPEEQQEITKPNVAVTPNAYGSSPIISASVETTEDEDESQNAYSNPMISMEEEGKGDVNQANNGVSGDQDEKMLQLRGDCIGSTTYSERHVLKILINWMKQLEVMRQQVGAEKLELGSDFDTELSLLWDMSTENDVAVYLVEKDIFSLLSESLSITECDRLIEITIGILVNLLSVSSILDKFRTSETAFQFLPRILSELMLCQRIPRLIQSLAAIRRVVWYISNVEFVEPWMKLLTKTEFIQTVNFLLKSCRNIGILSELVTILFMLLEIIRDKHKLLKRSNSHGIKMGNKQKIVDSYGGSSSEDDSDLEEEQNADNVKGKSFLKSDNYVEIVEFCKHGLVVSLCESFQELLKYPVIDPGLWPNSSAAKRHEDDTNGDDLQAIPPNAIQQSICFGLNTFEYIHKIKSCREYLFNEASTILDIYTDFYHKFHLYTQHVSNVSALNHFGEGLKLVGYYQSKMPSIVSKAIIIEPLAAAMKFKLQEEKTSQEKQKEEQELKDKLKEVNIELDEHEDLITSIAVITHEYFSKIGDKFGLESVHKIVLDDKNEKLARFLDFINVVAQNLQQPVKLEKSSDSDFSDTEFPEIKHKNHTPEDLKTCGNK